METAIRILIFIGFMTVLLASQLVLSEPKIPSSVKAGVADPLVEALR